jgi:hypothetical protein
MQVRHHLRNFSKILKLDAPYNVIYAGGKDNVRHKGDYTIISKKNPWPLWGKMSALDPEEAQDRLICNMIAMEFQPVIRRKISMDY